MKSLNGIYIPPFDPTDYVPKEKRMGNMSIRSIKQLAAGSTPQEFERMCDSGLSTVDDLGRDLHGRELYDQFSSYCREET